MNEEIHEIYYWLKQLLEEEYGDIASDPLVENRITNLARCIHKKGGR